MLIRLVRIIQKRTIVHTNLQRNTDRKENQGSENTGKQLTESKQKVQLMQDKYQKLNIQGLQQRHITGVDSFQRDILTQNKFDLLDPRIKPRVASLSTSMGLQLSENNQLTQVNLGKIKVKQQNQVFLSQVDPNNIPEYYEIIFDYEKQMSLVGKRIQGEQKGKDQTQGEMKISSRRAFEQKTQEEFTKDIFGFGFKIEMSYRVIMKKILLTLFITYFFYQPFIATQAQIHFCLKSITDIEKQKMSQLQKFKREAFINAILTNPDMQTLQ